MKISEHWLRTWVNPDVETAALGHNLTMAGLELAGIEAAAPHFTGVVVGQIETIEPHPHTDKCQMTAVNVGGARNLAIVCGAKNIQAGDKVAVAVDGAMLPGDFAIAVRKVYSTISEGMICSEAELGLAASADGVMILAPDAPIGEDFRAYAKLDDAILEVELTPNRGDCLSMRGMAREVGVIQQAEVIEPAIEVVTPTIDDHIKVKLAEPTRCPCYLARVIRKINQDAKTPLWMSERLRRSGIKTIHPVVDVLNYVMIELGQPMHAFDLAKIQGGIEVRLAKAKEQVTLLDSNALECREDTLVVADDHQVLALAGVMGSHDSAVTNATSDILLESAHFTQLAVAGKARSYGLVTDAAQRFERGVDWQLPAQAMERATELLVEIVGGEVGPIVEATEEQHLPEHAVASLSKEQLTRLLGMEIEDFRVTDILERLGLEPAHADGIWQCTVPSYRFDIRIGADLVEEVARVYGYDNIASSEPLRGSQGSVVGERANKVPARRMQQLLIDLGYQEIITYSFVDPKLQQLMEPATPPLTLLNPMASDLGVMRTSLMQGLLTTLRYNQNRQVESMRLFEVGLCYQAKTADPRTVADLVQEKRIAGLWSGEVNELNWQGKEPIGNFYDLKGDVEALLGLTMDMHSFSFAKGEHPFLHPGQTAKICRGNTVVGYIGALHPRIAQALGMKNNQTYLFELALAPLQDKRTAKFRPLSKFPSIRRDICIVVDEEITANQISQVVCESVGDLLTDLQIFDLYRGDNIEKSKKSMALGLTLQHRSRTLIDSEVNLTIDNVVGALKTKLSALMRD